MNLSPSPSPRAKHCLVQAEGQLMPWDVYIYNPEWMATCCRLMGVHVYSVGFKDLDRLELKLGSHTLAPQNVSPAPSSTHMKLWQGSSFILKVHGNSLYTVHRIDYWTDRLSRARLMPHSKGALQSLSFLHRIMKTLPREARRDKKPQLAPFSTCTENRESKVLASHAAGCQLCFSAKANKRLSRFSFCYPPHTRQTSKWQQTVPVIKMFCCWYILLKSCGIFYLRQESLTMSIIKWPQMKHLSADCWKPEYCKDKKRSGLTFHKASRA